MNQNIKQDETKEDHQETSNENPNSIQRRISLQALQDFFKQTGSKAKEDINKDDNSNVNEGKSDRNDIINASTSSSAAASTSTTEQSVGGSGIVAPIQTTADVLKLDIDCFHEVFDFMSLIDLISIGQTCKRLSHVAGTFFQQNYSHVKVFCSKDHFLVGLTNKYEADSFIQFLKQVTISYTNGDLDLFVYFQPEFSKTKLRKLELSHIKARIPQIKRMAETLGKLEVLRLEYFAVDWCINQNMLSRCHNLKYLSIEGDPHNSIVVGSSNNWLRQSYPKLEHLELAMRNPFKVNELIEFFALNPNVTRFSTYTYFFWENRNAFLNADIKLDDLAVNAIFEKTEDFNPLVNVVNELYDRGFYKRLQFSHNRCTQELIDQLASAKGLVKLYFMYGPTIRLSSLNTIEEFLYEHSDYITDLEEIGTNLPSLQRIHFVAAYLDHIYMLICRAPNLKKIIVNQFVTSSGRGFQSWVSTFLNLTTYPNNTIIDLSKLNTERARMPEARKITLYVSDNVYLATKWTLNKTNFELVRLMRWGAIERPYPWD